MVTLDRFGDLTVCGWKPRLGVRGGDGIAHEGVHEAVATRPVGRLDQPGVDGLVDRHQDRHRRFARRRRHESCVELTADDRRHRQRAGAGRGAGVEPVADCVTHGRRDRRHIVPCPEVSCQLADEQGVAAAPLGHLDHQRVVVPESEQLGDGVALETAEVESTGEREALELLDRRCQARSVVDGTRAVSGEQQHTASDRAGHVHEEPDGGDVDLMDVVEHDQQAVRCGSRGERVGDLEEACEPLDLRLGVRPRVEDVITTESRQHLAPRPERRRPFLLGTPAPHDGDTGGCGDRAQFVGETRLADAWFAAEQDEARRSRQCFVEPPRQGRQLAVSPDQRLPHNEDRTHRMSTDDE